MKKIIYILAMSLGMILAASCQDEVEPAAKPFFEVSPATMDSEAVLGDGDAVVISIKSNMAWTISVEYTGSEKDWIKFEQTEGEGSADVFGIVLRGVQGADRNCTITVATKDGSRSVDLKVKQGIFVPKIIDLTLLDVINTAGEAGVAKELLDFSHVAVQVAAKEKAENILTEEGCVIVTDGNNFVKAKLPGASALNEGDNLVIDLTEGTVTKENGGGYMINITQNPVSKEPGTLDLKPAYIASTSVASYPYALVKVGGCQATDAFVGKTWGAGTVTMDMVENEVGTVDIAVDSKASFAGTAVPENSGTVIGFSIDGKVHPRNAEDLAGLSNGRTKKYEIIDFKIKPVVNLLQYGGAENKYANTTNVGTTRVEFSNSEGYSCSGAAIEMNTSTKIAYVVKADSPTQACFTTIGWQPGKSYYQYEVPIQEKTWGDLEFGFSVSHGTAANLPWEWEITWSKDNNTYKPVEALYCIASNEIVGANVVKQKSNGYADSRYLALISIPESEAMQQGEKLYFRCNLKSATKCTTALTVRMNSGFYLASAAKNDPAPQYDNILAAENFDNCNVGLDLVIGAPLDYFAAWTTQTAYPSRNGWTVSGGKAAYKSMLVFSGEPAVYSPKLSKLSGTSDVTVKFKICLFTSQDRANSLPTASGRQKLDTFKVTATGGGTAQDIVWETDPESDYYNWHTGTCKISGATPETSVAISSAAATGKFYIKDIIITK